MTSGALAWPLGFVLIRSLAIIEAVRPSRAISSGSGVAATHIPAADARTGTRRAVLVTGGAIVRWHYCSPWCWVRSPFCRPSFIEAGTPRGRRSGQPIADPFMAFLEDSFWHRDGLPTVAAGRLIALWLSAHDPGEPWWHRGASGRVGAVELSEQDRAEAEQCIKAMGQALREASERFLDLTPNQGAEVPRPDTP